MTELLNRDLISINFRMENFTVIKRKSFRIVIKSEYPKPTKLRLKDGRIIWGQKWRSKHARDSEESIAERRYLKYFDQSLTARLLYSIPSLEGID